MMALRYIFGFFANRTSAFVYKIVTYSAEQKSHCSTPNVLIFQLDCGLRVPNQFEELNLVSLAQIARIVRKT